MICYLSLLLVQMITSASLGFAAVASISFLSSPVTNSVAACSHFLFHSKPVCSFLSPFPRFFLPSFPSILKFLNSIPFPSNHPLFLSLHFLSLRSPFHSFSSVPPYSLSVTSFSLLPSCPLSSLSSLNLLQHFSLFILVLHPFHHSFLPSPFLCSSSPSHLLVTLWLLVWACGPAWQSFACVACLTFIQIQRKGSVHPIRVSQAFLKAGGLCVCVRGVGGLGQCFGWKSLGKQGW